MNTDFDPGLADNRLPPLTELPPGVNGVADYEALARPRMAPDAWAHISGGAGDGDTMRANRAAYARWHIAPRVMQPMAGANTATRLLGQSFAHPLMLAPIAYQRLAHPQGELASAEAALLLGGGFIAGTLASYSIEEIAQVARRGMQSFNAAHADGEMGMPWFQLYLQRKREHTLSLVRRAEDAGYAALVLTVDAPVKLRAGFTLPPDVQAVNLKGQTEPADPTPSLVDAPLLGQPLVENCATWADVDWLRGQTRLPIWIKGILTAHDAREALARGADGLIVSNHGGRVFDSLPPTLAMLPAVVGAVHEWADARGGAPAPVLMDGGIRRGADAFKALCLGASAVIVGRPFIHALATAGALGVAHAIHLLRAELELAMTIAGCRSLAELGPERLLPAA